MTGIELANYIVEKQIENYAPTDTLSLQKVIYFVNAEYMNFRGEPTLLIEDNLEKWKYGPVVPSVYYEYSFFGSMPITNLPFTQILSWDRSSFLRELKKRFNLESSQLDVWIDKYITKDRFELVNLTHEHHCWKVDETRILNGEKNIIYDVNEIFEEIRSDRNLFFGAS